MVLMYGVQFIWIMYTVQEIWVSIHGNLICDQLGQLLFSVFTMNKSTQQLLSFKIQTIQVQPKALAYYLFN